MGTVYSQLSIATFTQVKAWLKNCGGIYLHIASRANHTVPASVRSRSSTAMSVSYSAPPSRDIAVRYPAGQWMMWLTAASSGTDGVDTSPRNRHQTVP
jgi:hypothetical protein